MFNDFLKAKGFFLTYESVEAHVSASKDMAWAFGLYKFKVPDSEMEVGKYVSVWEKKSGKWKNVAEIRMRGDQDWSPAWALPCAQLFCRTSGST